MARRPHVGNATEFSKLEQGGRLLLSVAMLGLTAACGGDQPLAPTAGPVAGPTAGGAAVTRSGVELLVLVDEAGQARRVLIVRDERDPRVRAVERLGFRELMSGSAADGGVSATTRQLFAPARTHGMPTRFLRAEYGERLGHGAMSVAGMEYAGLPRSALATGLGASNGGEPRAILDSALLSLENNLNAILAEGAMADERNIEPHAGTAVAPDGGEEPCADERSDANVSRAQVVAMTLFGAAEIMVVGPTPLLPFAVAQVGYQMGQVYAQYHRDMRELRQCIAAHPEYYR